MDRKRANRATMPQVAKIVDILQAEFGQVKVTFASEGGVEYGKAGPKGNSIEMEYKAEKNELSLPVLQRKERHAAFTS